MRGRPNRMSAADTPPTRSALEPLLGNLFWYSDTDFQIGAIDSVLVGGKLRLIENEDVRYFLASLPGRLEIIKKIELQDYALQRDVIAPYFRANTNLPQIVQSNVIDAYNSLRPDLNNVIGLLDAELGDSP